MFSIKVQLFREKPNGRYFFSRYDEKDVKFIVLFKMKLCDFFNNHSACKSIKLEI